MSNDLGSRTDARNAGVARIRNVTRSVMVGAALLSGAFAGLAAASTHVKKATHARTQSARRVTTVTKVPAAVPQPAPSSAQVPAPVAPSDVPTQSIGPPLVSSGGS
jgi:hypothetical protein